MYLQEKTVFDLDLGTKVTWNIAQYLYTIWAMQYAPAKFEVAKSNGKGGAYLQENTIFDPDHKSY